MSDLKEGSESVSNEPFASHSLDLRKCSDVAAEIMEECDQNSLAPAAVLRFCKRKVLIPYLHLLALTGLRSSPPGLFPAFRRNPDVLGSPCFGRLETDGSCCAYFASAMDFIHLLLILLLMILGHILQYMACFQPIGGFCLDCGACGTFYISIVTYIIPGIVLFVAHCHILWLFRVQEVEQLPNLMERVFLLSSRPELSGISRHHSLVHRLWFLILAGAFWALISLAHLTWLIYTEENFKISLVYIESSTWINGVLRVILIMGMGWQEVSKAAIITSYCIHAHLLSYYLKMLHNSLLSRCQSPLDWMREVAEFKGLLSHFNDDLSPSAVAIAALSIAWAVAGTMKLISTPVLHAIFTWTTPQININNQSNYIDLSAISSDKGMDSILQHNSSLPFVAPLQPLLTISPLDVLSVILRLLLGLVPLVQAARVTSACRILRSAGHAVRARPFAYRNAPPSPSLDSLLLYTSSLRLSATLLPCARLPVTPSCLFATIFLSVLIPVIILILIVMVHTYQIPQL